MKIQVQRPEPEELGKLGVFSWDIWTCEPSEFSWSYSDREICYLLEGQVTVEAGAESVSFGKGDLVTFPAGLSCVWKVRQPVRKHYRFG